MGLKLIHLCSDHSGRMVIPNLNSLLLEDCRIKKIIKTTGKTTIYAPAGRSVTNV